MRKRTEMCQCSKNIHVECVKSTWHWKNKSLEASYSTCWRQESIVSTPVCCFYMYVLRRVLSVYGDYPNPNPRAAIQDPGNHHNADLYVLLHDSYLWPYAFYK